MLSISRKVESLLLDSFAIAVMALSIGLAMMIMLMGFALTATLAILAKLSFLRQRKKNERTQQTRRWRPLQVGHSAD